jgi:DNA-binding NtrC family response regulator
LRRQTLPLITRRLSFHSTPRTSSVKEAVRLGAYDYVAKPVAPQDVINVTDGAITRKQWALHRVPEDLEVARGTCAT